MGVRHHRVGVFTTPATLVIRKTEALTPNSSRPLQALSRASPKQSGPSLHKPGRIRGLAPKRSLSHKAGKLRAGLLSAAESMKGESMVTSVESLILGLMCQYSSQAAPVCMGHGTWYPNPVFHSGCHLTVHLVHTFARASQPRSVLPMHSRGFERIYFCRTFGHRA